MSCFFACFGAKVDNKILDFQPPFVATITAKENETAAAGMAKVVVSRHQLSDLFASQEMEDVSYHEKSAQFQSVDTQNCNDKVVVSDKLPDQTCTPPAMARESKTLGLNSQEESPTSCISDPTSASRNSVSNSLKSENGNLYDTSKESSASQTVTPSGNNNRNNQKTKNGPVSSSKNLQPRGSMSSGLKPVVRNKAGSGRSPRDRPVLRNVTAQWNGNGIPNSTNKYREDQIVSWDGTPFEERLEKALSEANSIAQRKHVSGAYDAFEEETDTAASQFHSLLHPECVV